MTRPVAARWARSSLWLALLALGSSACGGLAVIDGDGSGGGGSSPTSNSASSSSTGGGGMLRIRLLDVLVSANCQPVVPADPLRVVFSLAIENTSSLPAEGTIVSAGLKGSPGATTFSVSPPSTGEITVGTMTDVKFTKVDGTASGTPGCNWCNASDARMVLEVDVSGQSMTLDEPISSASCTF